MRCIWLAWERHRRSAELARAFGAEYRPIDFASLPRLLRYVACTAVTFAALLSRPKPRIVFVQSPSIFLAFLAALMKPLLGYVLIIDAHNAVPNYHRSGKRFLEGVVRFSTRRADLVIVSNDTLAPPIRAMGGEPAVLPDRLPSIDAAPMPERLRRGALPVVTLISTFNWDEPIATFIEGAQAAKSDFILYVTGRREKAGDLLRFESERVLFTGFLPDRLFEGLIGNSDLIADLTTDESVLVCGAYEAVAVGVPLLLVDASPARRLFTAGTLFAENSVGGYRDALDRFFADRGRYAAEMKSFAPRFEQEWARAFRLVDDQVRNASGGKGCGDA